VDHTYRVTEIVGSSPEGVDQAIRNGITRANATLRQLDWFGSEKSRHLVDGGSAFQVTVKVGFRLEDVE
jgi:flavin-binding protein dodecin